MTSGGWQAGARDAITDVPGFRVGHWTDRRRATGCTVVVCPPTGLAAVDARGGAPGTRETDVLAAANLVRRCDAIVFAGGSAFGLAAAEGAMRFLAAEGRGFGTTARRVPIVPSAVLYDLGVGSADAFPGAEEGHRAASRARGGAVAQGSVGAGTGATVAKLLGPEHSLKGGIGTASLLGPRKIVVGALVANNAVGAIGDPATGEIVAGPRGEPGRFVPLPEAMALRTARMDSLREATTLICVATNAALEHHQLQRVAIQAHDGLARAVLPAHTFGDGDIAFAVSSGQAPVEPYDALTVGLLATVAVERALLRSVRLAKGLKGVPSAAEWRASAPST